MAYSVPVDSTLFRHALCNPLRTTGLREGGKMIALIRSGKKGGAGLGFEAEQSHVADGDSTK